MAMILLSVDKSVSMNEDSDKGGDSRWVGSGFRRVVSSVLSLVVIPDSCKHLLVLWVRSGVRVEGCRDKVGLLGIEECCQCQKKVEGSRVRQPTLRWASQTGSRYLHYTEVGTLVTTIERISIYYTFVAQKWERSLNIKNNGLYQRIFGPCK